MKKLFTICLVCATSFMIKAQDAQVYLTFENGEIIPTEVTGVTSVDADASILIKTPNNGSDIVQGVNSIVDEGGENVLFTDYNGYLKFDKTILNKTSFTIMSDFKWTGNFAWWIGMATFVGYDSDGNPEADPVVPAGYVFNHLNIKDRAGQLDGLGMATSDKPLTQDVYHHLALTYNSGELYLYVDGVEKASGSGSELHLLNDLELYWGVKLSADASSGDVTPWTDGNGNSKCAQVFMDNVALFDNALTAQQIADIAAGTSIPTDIDLPVIKSKVYPNPFVSEISFDSDIKTVKVFDLSGKMIVTKALNNSKTINLSELTKGVYVVQLGKENGVMETVKLVKK